MPVLTADRRIALRKVLPRPLDLLGRHMLATARGGRGTTPGITAPHALARRQVFSHSSKNGTTADSPIELVALGTSSASTTAGTVYTAAGSMRMGKEIVGSLIAVPYVLGRRDEPSGMWVSLSGLGR